MNQKQIKNIDGENYIYHRFIFERCAEAGKERFMPNLVAELKKVLGEENYIYDGYEIGEEDFGLYFFIKAELYEQLLQKVKLWSKAVDVDKFMRWDFNNLHNPK